MGAVVTFLRSPAGMFHVAAAREFGQDPAGFIDNDYVAFNLRAGAVYLDRTMKREAREEAANPALRLERWIEGHG